MPSILSIYWTIQSSTFDLSQKTERYSEGWIRVHPCNILFLLRIHKSQLIWIQHQLGKTDLIYNSFGASLKHSCLCICLWCFLILAFIIRDILLQFVHTHHESTKTMISIKNNIFITPAYWLSKEDDERNKDFILKKKRKHKIWIYLSKYFSPQKYLSVKFSLQHLA